MRRAPVRRGTSDVPMLDQQVVDGVAAKAAVQLAELGLVRGASMAVVSRNRPELLVFHIAGRSLGASVVFIDPDSPVADPDAMLAEVDPVVVVCEHVEQVPFVRSAVPAAQVIALVDAPTGTDGLSWSLLVGGRAEVARSTFDERLLCDAHLAEPGACEVLTQRLRDGAAISLIPPGADRHAAGAFRPTTLATTPARLEALARELRRRAPLRRVGDDRALGWSAGAASVPIVWVLATLLDLGSSSGRASTAMAAALVVAVAALLAGRRRPEAVVGAGAALAVACDAAESAPSVMAAARFVVAVVPVAALLAALARSSREVAWATASRAAKVDGRSPVGGLRSALGRFVSWRVRAALGFPSCGRVVVVGGAPADAVVAELAVAGLELSATDEAASTVSLNDVLLLGAGEVG